MKRIIFILLLFSCSYLQAQINNLQRPFAGFSRDVSIGNIAYIDSSDIGGFFVVRDVTGNPVDNLNIFPTKNPSRVWVRLIGSSVSTITGESNTYLFEDSTNTPPLTFPAGVDTTFWMIGGAPTGIWVGHDFDVARYVNGVFDVFIDPNVNDWGYTLDDNFWHQYNGSTWPRRNPDDWTTAGNEHGGVFGSLVPQPVLMRYNNLDRIILNNAGVRFPQLGGVTMGVMGLNATGGSRRLTLDTLSFSFDDDTLRVLGGTLQTAFDNSIVAGDNPIIDADGNSFTLYNANDVRFYGYPHSPNVNSSIDILTGDAALTRYGGFSSSFHQAPAEDSSIISIIVSKNTLTQKGHQIDVTDTGIVVRQLWGGASLDNTIQQFAHPPSIAGQKYYIPVSVNGEVADATGNITISTGGGGGITQEQLDDSTAAIRADFPAGGGGAAANVYAPLIKTNDTISQRFNVLHYGAVGDSVTNDAPAIQAAINAADAAGGGVVYFPKPAIYYNIGNALNATYNSQLYIPVNANSSARNHIILMGEAAPNFSPVGAAIPTALTTKAVGGTRLKSTITTGAAGAAIIGTALHGSTIPNQTNLTVENLAFEVKNNPAGAGPVIGGINWKNGAEIFINKVVVYVDTAGIYSTLPTNDVSGIETPDNLSGSSYLISNSLVAGFRHGYKISEHVTMDNAGAWFNYNAIYAKIGYHASYIARVCLQWNRNDIYFGGPLALNASQFDLEHIDAVHSGGRWYDNVATIKDTANLGKGAIFYQIMGVGIGVDDANFVKDGGVHINEYSIADSSRFPKLNGSNIYYAPGSSLIQTLNSDANQASYIRWQKAGNNRWRIATNDNGDGKFEWQLYNYQTSTAKIYADSTGVINVGGDASTLGSTAASFLSNTNVILPGSVRVGSTSAPSSQLDVTSSASNVANFTSTAAANMTVNWNASTNRNVNFVFQNGGANIWYVGNEGAAGDNSFRLFNSDANGNSKRFNLAQNGILTLNAYGAGTATFDASGNISSVSDERVKRNIHPYRTGLRALMKINPISFQYNGLSGNEINGTYAGFSAQNVAENIPNSTGITSDGYLTLQDRAILATLVNAVKEQQKEIEELKAEIKKLK